MPTIVFEGYRFGFWFADCAEPPHVYVTRDGKRGDMAFADQRRFVSGT